MPGTVSPPLQGKLGGPRLVFLELPCLAAGEFRVKNVEVGLVVEAKRAVVEVGGADRDARRTTLASV